MASVPGYVHTPGHHCGSTALRNLLAFHGVELSEEMAFGLGAGAGFYYLAIDGTSPSRWFNGRTARLEESFRELTGAALELRTFGERRRRRLGGGAGGGRRRPPGAAADRHLPPRPLRQLGPLPRPRGRPRRLRRGGRLPLRHRLRASCRRRGWRTSARARHADHPAVPLEGHMFTVAEGVEPASAGGGGPGGDRARRERDAGAAVRRVRRPAGARAARRRGRLLARGGRGLAVVRALRLPGDRAPRHRRRRLPADVLALPRRGRDGPRRRWRRPPASAGASWRRPSALASESEQPEPGPWREVGAGAERVAAAERRLWTALGARLRRAGTAAHCSSSKFVRRSAEEHTEPMLPIPHPIEGDDHVRRVRRTAALTRLALGGLGIALILAQPELLPHPELGVAGFATVVATSLIMLATRRLSWLRFEESVAALAAMLIVGMGDETVTVVSLLWLVAVATGVMGRGGRVHWVGVAGVLVGAGAAGRPPRPPQPRIPRLRRRRRRPAADQRPPHPGAEPAAAQPPGSKPRAPKRCCWPATSPPASPTRPNSCPPPGAPPPRGRRGR